MAPFDLSINGRDTRVDVDPATPLLWVLRDHLNLTGTKFGCGRGLCGACTVHINGVATPAVCRSLERGSRYRGVSGILTPGFCAARVEVAQS